MYCKNCGALLEDNVKFCSNCGTQLDVTKKQFDKTNITKIAKIAIPILAVVVVITIVASLIGNGGVNSSPEKVAAAAVESIYLEDYEKMIECFADYMVSDYAERYGLSPDASRKDLVRYMEDQASEYENSDDSKQKIKITDIETIDISILQDSVIYDDYYYEDMSYSVLSTIEQVAEIEVHFLIEGEEEWHQVICIEIDGKWYFFDID